MANVYETTSILYEIHGGTNAGSPFAGNSGSTGEENTVGKHDAPKEDPKPIKLPKPTADGDRPIKKGGK